MAFNQALLDVITEQNNHIASGHTPHGLPHDYSWYAKGSGMVGYKQCPSGFTSGTGWFHLYPKEGAPNPPSTAKFYIRKWRVDLHKTSGGWIEGAYVGTPDKINGSMFNAVMTPANPGAPGWTKSAGPEPDSTTLQSPVHGIMNHSWTAQRVSYPINSVNGVLVYIDFKVDGSGAQLITQAGFDWWRDPGAPFKSDFSNNPGLGTNDWELLSPSQWKTSYYTNINPDQLKSDPPALLRDTGTTVPPIEPPVEPGEPPPEEKYMTIEVDGKVLASGARVTFICP